MSDVVLRCATCGSRQYVCACLGAHLEAIAASIARLRAVAGLVRDLAEGDCEYDDGCPPFTGSRHGTCTSCKARAALAALQDGDLEG